MLNGNGLIIYGDGGLTFSKLQDNVRPVIE